MLNTEEKASKNVKLQLVDPYTTQSVRMGGNIKFNKLEITNHNDELDFLSDEEIEQAERAKQNAILALITMPRNFVDTEAPAPGLYTLAVYSHASFVNAFNILTNEEKKEIKVLRSYWVGDSSNLPKIRESSDVSKLVSEYLVDSLAEKVRLYKANVNTGRLTPFKKTLDESVYKGGKEYREELEDIKGKSKYELDVIKALAEGKEPKLPDTDRAFMANTPILTKEEIKLVLEKVAKNSEPTLPYRPASQTSQATEIANAIKEALKSEKNTKTKTGE